MAKITVKTKGTTKSFRRAGRAFTSEATEIDSADLTPEQIEQLRAEGANGMLDVTGLPPAATPAATDAARAARVASPGAGENTPTLGGHGSVSPSKAEVQATGAGAAAEHEAERTSPRRR